VEAHEEIESLEEANADLEQANSEMFDAFSEELSEAEARSTAPQSAGGSLLVTVVQADELVNKDTFSQSDPYCILTCGTDHFQTETVQDDSSPVWHQSFEFSPRRPDHDTLQVDIFDCDVGDGTGHDNSLGSVTVQVKDVIAAGVMEKAFPVGKKTGTLTLRLIWQAATPIPAPQSTMKPPKQQAKRESSPAKPEPDVVSAVQAVLEEPSRLHLDAADSEASRHDAVEREASRQREAEREAEIEDLTRRIHVAHTTITEQEAELARLATCLEEQVLLTPTHRTVAHC